MDVVSETNLLRHESVVVDNRCLPDLTKNLSFLCCKAERYYNVVL